MSGEQSETTPAPKKDVLFLDIDGVLVTGRTMLATPLKHIAARTPDPVAIQYLNRLGASNKNLRIVISSTWRMMPDISDILMVMGLNTYTFREDGMAEAYFAQSKRMDRDYNIAIGRCTPIINGKRGAQIAAWLNKFGHLVDRWAILDDDSDMLPEQMDRFVKTDSMDGISFDNMKRLNELLLPPDCKMIKEMFLL